MAIDTLVEIEAPTVSPREMVDSTVDLLVTKVSPRLRQLLSDLHDKNGDAFETVSGNSTHALHDIEEIDRVVDLALDGQEVTITIRESKLSVPFFVIENPMDAEQDPNDVESLNHYHLNEGGYENKAYGTSFETTRFDPDSEADNRRLLECLTATIENTALTDMHDFSVAEFMVPELKGHLNPITQEVTDIVTRARVYLKPRPQAIA